MDGVARQGDPWAFAAAGGASPCCTPGCLASCLARACALARWGLTTLTASAGWRGPAASTADELSVADLDEPVKDSLLRGPSGTPLGTRLSCSEGGRSLETATGEGLGDVGMRPGRGPVALTTLGLRVPTAD